jgi:hypothetical protein
LQDGITGESGEDEKQEATSSVGEDAIRCNVSSSPVFVGEKYQSTTVYLLQATAD